MSEANEYEFEMYLNGVIKDSEAVGEARGRAEGEARGRAEEAEGLFRVLLIFFKNNHVKQGQTATLFGQFV